MTENNKKLILVECPFCKDKDFDLEGLKGHIENNYCDVYDKIEYTPSFFS